MALVHMQKCFSVTDLEKASTEKKRLEVQVPRHCGRWVHSGFTMPHPLPVAQLVRPV
jgi:hypothetical protein